MTTISKLIRKSWISKRGLLLSTLLLLWSLPFAGTAQSQEMSCPPETVRDDQGLILESEWKASVERCLNEAIEKQRDLLQTPRRQAFMQTIDAAANTSAVSKQDSLILVKFYDVMGGRDWRYNDNWLTGPVSSWFGVDVSNGRVKGLDLESNFLNGPFIPELSNLTQLQYLRLGDNSIHGTIPPELGNLTNLQELSLSYNLFGGTIPPELGNLTNLKGLWLDNQLPHFTTTDQLGGPIPPELGNLINLEILDLSWNKHVGGIPPELGNLTRLTSLNLSYIPLTGPIPPELGNLKNLRYLDLTGIQLTGSIPSWLSNLVNLEHLHLASNKFDGTIPAELASLKNLKSLALDGNQLNGSIPPELGSLENLERLNLSSNQLTGSIPPEPGSLSKMWELCLTMNQLSDSIPPELGNLKNLTSLHLNNNQLSGTLPPELGSLPRLSDLIIYSNPLSGAIPKSFTDLKNLRRFYFYDTNLCEPTDPNFQNWIRGLLIVRGTDETCGTDTTPPECEIVELTKGGHIKVRTQDTDTGLKDITVLKEVNAAVTIEPLEAGSADPVMVTATKINPKKRSVLALRITDMAENVTECDPVVTTLTAETPESFLLEQNYPNPFNPETIIRFQVAEPVHVSLEVYDMLGRRVVSLVNEDMAPGKYEVMWDGRSETGLTVPGGTYLCRFRAGSFTDTMAITFLK